MLIDAESYDYMALRLSAVKVRLENSAQVIESANDVRIEIYKRDKEEVNFLQNLLRQFDEDTQPATDNIPPTYGTPNTPTADFQAQCNHYDTTNDARFRQALFDSLSDLDVIALESDMADFWQSLWRRGYKIVPTNEPPATTDSRVATVDDFRKLATELIQSNQSAFRNLNINPKILVRVAVDLVWSPIRIGL